MGNVVPEWLEGAVLGLGEALLARLIKAGAEKLLGSPDASPEERESVRTILGTLPGEEVERAIDAELERLRGSAR